MIELIPSEPPQLPGKCPEPKRGRSWIPFRGHCYYVHTTSEESWPDASMMCIQMGKCLFLLGYITGYLCVWRFNPEPNDNMPCVYVCISYKLHLI